MTLSDLKLKIFQQIDSLEKDRLPELYGILINYINGGKDASDWEKLTEEQKQGINDAIQEIDSGKGVSHEEAMAKIRKTYNNG